jgi:V/A-type H+-transporting ATPase subunit E
MVHMKGIEALIKKLEEESRAECEEKLRKAEDEAQKIKEDYRARAETEAAKLIEQACKNAEADTRRVEGNDALEASKILLAAKHEVIDNAFARANELLCSLPEDEYIDFLKKYALCASETGSESIVLNKRDRDKLGERLVCEFNAALAAAGKPANLTLSEATAEINGGFLLRTKSVETDCSISSLVNRQKNTLTDTVAKILFR